MTIFNFLLTFLIAISPPSSFECDGDTLTATIRNNLNGDFAVVHDLQLIDEGAFVVLEWKKISLMLPVSFQKGEISFSDKKWLWSYQDNQNGLHEETPRFAQRLSDGSVIEHKCKFNNELY
ncbi:MULTISPECIES: hypothetical protein [unclassified Prochlorococcus]|uniref:hypothetical protein n=1 Tax=unclassified Prochlorococcus TaxID=2627481 RepID=UPI000533A660|nr:MULTISPECIES: hypothetical protein [unclassified Prochlorococcus]KGG15002.1 hypothetical protein EV06_1516 [Prochlorococcus sp. MIT 0602]KGG17159.1 hypothetical protein EV07_0594 [Prochlorococcus sp. MIT 0603]